MVFLDVIRAEMKFVYADIFRRRALLLMMVLWPYLMTLFIVFLGSTLGSIQVFINRFGVNPVPFFIIGSFILLSTLGVLDDIMWKPLYDEMVGVLPYILSSPINRILYYVALPIPRLLIVFLVGMTSVLPILYLFYGLKGILLTFVTMLLASFAALVFTPFVIVCAMLTYIIGGESWRALNVIRPMLFILLGIFYPRWLLPLTLFIVSNILPAAPVVELIQRILLNIVASQGEVLSLLGLAIALGFLYLAPARRLVSSWERRKIREGVRI